MFCIGMGQYDKNYEPPVPEKSSNPRESGTLTAASSFSLDNRNKTEKSLLYSATSPNLQSTLGGLMRVEEESEMRPEVLYDGLRMGDIQHTQSAAVLSGVPNAVNGNSATASMNNNGNDNPLPGDGMRGKFNTAFSVNTSPIRTSVPTNNSSMNNIQSALASNTNPNTNSNTISNTYYHSDMNLYEQIIPSSVDMESLDLTTQQYITRLRKECALFKLQIMTERNLYHEAKQEVETLKAELESLKNLQTNESLKHTEELKVLRTALEQSVSNEMKLQKLNHEANELLMLQSMRIFLDLE